MEKLLTVNGFIRKTKENPYDYIHYCEIIITEAGLIVEAIPSHQQTLLRLCAEKYGVTAEDYYNKHLPVSASPNDYMCEDINAIAVYYHSGIAGSGVNRFQKKTLIALQKAGLISGNFDIVARCEKSVCTAIENEVNVDKTLKKRGFFKLKDGNMISCNYTLNNSI